MGKSGHVTSDVVVKEFKKKFPKEKNLDDVFGVDSDYDEGRMLTMDYYRKIGLKSLPMVILNGFLLKENEIEDEAFEESVITKVMQITPEIQMAVYKGTIYDKTNILDWLMNKETIMPRLNPRVLTLERSYLDIKVFEDDSNAQKQAASRTSGGLLSLKYLQNENEAMHPLTLWIVCDPDTVQGREFLYEAINFYEASKIGTRLAVILQKSTSEPNNDLVKKAIYFALSTLKQNKANGFIRKLLREKAFNELKQNAKTISQLDIKVYITFLFKGSFYRPQILFLFR